MIDDQAFKKIEYSRTEQEAIVSVLYNLSYADFRKHELENDAYKVCLEDLGFSDDKFVPFVMNELQSRAFEILRHLSKEKKRGFSLMMTKVARSDGEFGVLERNFVTEILDMCEVPFVSR